MKSLFAKAIFLIAVVTGIAVAPAWAAAPMVVSGVDYTCTLSSVGGVYCWGAISNIGASAVAADQTTPVHVVDPTDPSGYLSNIVAITGGLAHLCALDAGGGVKCWGQNDFGQLGDGTSNPTDSSVPVEVTAGLNSGVVAVTAGDDHTCAVTSAGTVWCWGANANGQLGNSIGVGSTAPNSTPSIVSGFIGNGVIAAGDNHACALDSTGAAWCWGANANGQLGDGTTTDSTVPVAVKNYTGGDISALAAGGGSTCAVDTLGGVSCWGAQPSSASNVPAPTATTAALPAGATLSPSGALSGTPTRGGTYPIAITTSNGLGAVATQTFTLTVNRSSAGVFSVFPASLDFGAIPVNVASAPQLVTVTNVGPTTAAIGPLSLQGNNRSQFRIDSVSTTCRTILTPGASCNVGVAFVPTAYRSAVVATLSIGTSTVSLTGTVAFRAASLAPLVFAFPSIPRGTNSTETFTYANTGSLPITGISVSLSGTNFVVDASGCAGTLQPGTSCPIVVTFAPAAGTIPGTKSATLTVRAQSTPQVSASITGAVNVPSIMGPSSGTVMAGTGGSFTTMVSGYPTPTVALTATSGMVPPGVTYGNGLLSVAATTPPGVYSLVLTASNGLLPNAVLNFALTVAQAPAITSANNVTFNAGTANTFTVTATGTPAPTFSETGTLPAGVTLSPSGALSGTPVGTGTYPITITASNGIGAVATQTFTLTVYQFSVFPAVLNFGTVQVLAASATQMVTVTNGGSAPMVVGAVQVTPPFAIVSNGCAAPVLPGGSCLIGVNYAPSVVHADVGTLSIGTIGSVSLTGKGLFAPGAFSVFPAALDFGITPLGYSGFPQLVTVTNVGPTSALPPVVLLQGNNHASFFISAALNTCSSILASGASCTVGVVFRPTNVGLAVAALSVGTTATVSLTGTVGPNASLAPLVFAFPSIPRGTNSTTETFTYTNTGSWPFTGISVSLSGTNFVVDASGCAGTLQPGTSCPIVVTFAPAAGTIPGTKSATLTVRTPNAPQVSASITGTVL